jgi:copper homeostasis protein CutC
MEDQDLARANSMVRELRNIELASEALDSGGRIIAIFVGGGVRNAQVHVPMENVSLTQMADQAKTAMLARKKQIKSQLSEWNIEVSELEPVEAEEAPPPSAPVPREQQEPQHRPPRPRRKS